MSISYYQSLLKFYYFQLCIHPKTWDNQRGGLNWAAESKRKKNILESPQTLSSSKDPIIRQGYQLVSHLKKNFKNKWKSKTDLRILVHRPTCSLSPGGYSLFSNLAEGLAFLGVPVLQFWDEPIAPLLHSFRPTVLLSSDAAHYLSFIDWEAVSKYRKKNELFLGLTASIPEYGNSALEERLSWAEAHGVNFYYSFRSQEYVRSRKSYQPFYKDGYQILTVEFGANPLVYFPVAGIEKDLNYVFLASSNTDKWQQYFKFLPPIVNHYPGVIDGPGWFRVQKWLPPELHRYMYARARVGLNLHIKDSLEWPSELNERTYILAACGVPQLIDNPLLLGKRFINNSFFVANTPKEYLDLFHFILEDTKEAQKRALSAQKQVLTKYTSFHRAESFIRDVQKLTGL